MIHSAGPWTYRRERNNQGLPTWIIDGQDTRMIAVLTYSNDKLADNGAGDARAIAAVPELVRALYVCLDRLGLKEPFKMLDARAEHMAQEALRRAGV